MHSLRQRRTKERGAAMAESVVAIPVFIILYCGAVFVHRTVVDKLETQREARRTSLTEALKGCPSTAGQSNAAGPSNAYMVNDLGHTTATVTRTNLVGAQTLGVRPLKITSSYRVTCNQRPSGGNIVAAADDLFSGLQSALPPFAPGEVPVPSASATPGPTPRPPPTPTPKPTGRTTTPAPALPGPITTPTPRPTPNGRTTGSP